MSASFSTTADQPGDLRISLSTENEVRYWTKALDCTDEQLREAIAAVGPMQLAVRKHLVATS